MLHLVSGGAGSGKSEYAEALALRSAAQTRVYLATMEVWDEESQERVSRHRAMRRGKGFQTVECPRNLSALQLPEDCAVLLEDLGNLVSNECFGGCGFGQAEEAIFAGVTRLAKHREVIIVTNELFSDGLCYDPETERYRILMAALHRCLARQADWVTEVVAGIPVYWKGAER